MTNDEELKKGAMCLFLNAVLLANGQISDEEYLKIKKQIQKKYHIA